MSSSRPRPIHNNLHHREIRSTPDEAEPSFSYEQESFMASASNHEGADDVEDEFHRRLAQQQSGHRRVSSGSHSVGSSFWRSTVAENAAQQGPSFSSANINGYPNNNHHTFTKSPNATTSNNTNNNNNSNHSSTHNSNHNANSKGDNVTTARERKTSGLLGAALQSHALSEGGTLHESWNGGHVNSHGHGNMHNNNSEPLHIRHRDSSASLEAKKKDKKEISKHRAGERRLKMESQTTEVEIGHIVDDTADTVDADNFNHNPINSPPDFGGVSHVSSSLDRSSSDQSTGSLLYGKTPNNSALLGKSSSLIFPTGVEAGGGRSGSGGAGAGDNGVYSEANNLKRRKINLLLDQCESVRFLKKKLVLNNLGLSAADIPVTDLCGTPLGNALHKLSLAGNRLVSVPAKLVQSLPTLKHLDLSQCELHQLPDQWNLPQLKRLNLSHNRLTEFPEEVCCHVSVSVSCTGKSKLKLLYVSCTALRCILLLHYALSWHV